MSFMCVSCEFSATKPLGERETLIEHEFLFKSLLRGDPYDRTPPLDIKTYPDKGRDRFYHFGIRAGRQLHSRRASSIRMYQVCKVGSSTRSV